MDKIKASELLKSLIKNTRTTFDFEGHRQATAILNAFGGALTYDQKDIVEAIAGNNDFLRISLAESVILTLADFDLIEMDINILDYETIKPIILEATEDSINNQSAL